MGGGVSLVLGAPRNVRLVMVQEDPPVVEITWQAPPRSPLAAILGYRVQYGIRGSSSDEMDERPLDADKYKYTTGFLGEYPNDMEWVGGGENESHKTVQSQSQSRYKMGRCRYRKEDVWKQVNV